MKTALFALSLITLSSGTWAATDSSQSPAPIVEDYAYGIHLDIAKVISTSDYNYNYCGIGPRELTYADSQGAVHTLRYPAFGDGCIDQG